jgi:hypothetical protein
MKLKIAKEKMDTLYGKIPYNVEKPEKYIIV